MNRRQVIAAAAAAATVLRPARAWANEGRWLFAETAMLRVYSEGEPDAMQDMAGELESFHKLLCVLTRTPIEPPPTKLTLYLSAWRPTMAEAYGRPLQNAAGFYSSGLDEVAAFAFNRMRGELRTEPLEILRHEYTHHFMLQHHPGIYPTWYVEGFAELLQTASFERERVTVGRPNSLRASWLGGGDMLPLQRLLAQRRYAGLNDDDLQRFYAQSWLLTHFVQFNPERQAGFARYIEALRQGQDPLAAVEPAFDMTVEAMEAELRRYRNGLIPLAIVTLPQSEPAAFEPRALPPAADRLLMLISRLRRDAHPDDHALILSEIRTRAAETPDDPFAIEVLASAEARIGETERAERLVAALLERAPDNGEAHHAQGILRLRQAERLEGEARSAACAAARASFAAANRLRPGAAGTLYRYAMSYAVAQEPMPEAAIEVLLEAQALAPQVRDYHVGVRRSVDGNRRVRSGRALCANRGERSAHLTRPVRSRP